MIPHNAFWSIEPSAMHVFSAAGVALRHTMTATTPHYVDPGVADVLKAQFMAAGGSAASAEIEVVAQRAPPLDVVGAVARIPIKGVMTKDPSIFSMFFGGAVMREITQAIRMAVLSEEVKTILLAIDSPGGSVDGLSDLGDAVRAAAKIKPVIAQVEGMAASAAYYVASQATEIIAGRTDVVGSIGTRMVLYDFSKAFEDEGIVPVVIDTGEFKSTGVMGAPITEPQKAELQRVTDFFFEDFVDAIVSGRPNMNRPAVRRVADGRMFPAPEALSLGLIDKIADPITTARRLTGPRRRTAAEVVRTNRVETTKAALTNGVA